MPRLTILALAALLAAPACAIAQDIHRAPEISTGYTEKAGWTAKKYMVAAANPHATEAGYQMLRQGGSAVDAAIAVQLVLTLVEPQSSGIGGGAFMMYADAKQVLSYDGRETAPAAADEKLFLRPDGSPMSREQGVVGGRSTGAPGVLRMLAMAHKQHGKLPWKTLFEPAIKLADGGFAVSPRLNALLSWDRHIGKDPVAAAYFYDKDGKPRPVGYVLKNPALAATLKELAEGGAEVFYTGHIAADIAAKVKSHPSNPGLLTAQDIAGYQPKLRQPVCTDYKSYRVCGMAPPSSGGVAIAQMLGIFEAKNIAQYAPVNGAVTPEGVHLFAEAGRLAYADRNRYIADPDFAPLPGRGVDSLIDRAYVSKRASLIGEKSMGQASPGVPAELKLAWGNDNAIENPATSHVVAVDGFGGVVSMTTTVEDAFGSRQMVDGFILNNQLTDFSFSPADANGPVANRVQGGKRPRSAMSPTLVFEKGSNKLLLATGSPGGSAIINYVAKVLVGVLDWNLSVQQAISLPNFGSRNGPTEFESKRMPPGMLDALKAKGHNVLELDHNSGLQGIMRAPKGDALWQGGADPRREGTAKGD